MFKNDGGWGEGWTQEHLIFCQVPKSPPSCARRFPVLFPSLMVFSGGNPVPHSPHPRTGRPWGFAAASPPGLGWAGSPGSSHSQVLRPILRLFLFDQKFTGKAKGLVREATWMGGTEEA